jgi:hypothetical protein
MKKDFEGESATTPPARRTGDRQHIDMHLIAGDAETSSSQTVILDLSYDDAEDIAVTI